MTPHCLFWEQLDRIFLYLTWAIRYFSFEKQAIGGDSLTTKFRLKLDNLVSPHSTPIFSAPFFSRVNFCSKLLLVEESLKLRLGKQTQGVKDQNKKQSAPAHLPSLGKPSGPLPAVLYRKLSQDRQTQAETEGEIDRMLPLEEQRVSGSEGHWPAFCQVCREGPRAQGNVVGGQKPLPTRKVSTAAGLRVYFAQPDAQGRRRWSQADHEIFNSTAIYVQEAAEGQERGSGEPAVPIAASLPRQSPFPAGAQLLGTHFLSQACGVGLAAGHVCRCPPGDAGRGHPGRAGGARWRRLLREALRASAARGPAAQTGARPRRLISAPRGPPGTAGQRGGQAAARLAPACQVPLPGEGVLCRLYGQTVVAGLQRDRTAGRTGADAQTHAPLETSHPAHPPLDRLSFPGSPRPARDQPGD